MIVELTINEHPDEEYTGKQRQGFEQLLRKLLKLPSRPAVMQASRLQARAPLLCTLRPGWLDWTHVCGSRATGCSYTPPPPPPLLSALGLQPREPSWGTVPE